MIKSFSADFLNVQTYEEANIVELKRVMVFTAVDDVKILFRENN